MADEVANRSPYWERKQAFVRHALKYLKGSAVKVYNVLEIEQDTPTATVKITIEDLADQSGSHRREVTKALQQLAGKDPESDAPYQPVCIEILEEGGGFGRGKLIKMLVVPPPPDAPSTPLFDNLPGEFPPELPGEFPPLTGGISQDTMGKTATYRGNSPPRIPATASLHTAPGTLGTSGGNSPGSLNGFAGPSRGGLVRVNGTAGGRGDGGSSPEEEKAAFLRGKGIYPKQARALAQHFTLKRLCELWREVERMPRVRNKGGAYATVLKSHIVE